MKHVVDDIMSTMMVQEDLHLIASTSANSCNDAFSILAPVDNTEVKPINVKDNVNEQFESICDRIPSVDLEKQGTYQATNQTKTCTMETKEKNESFIIPYICSGACNSISISPSVLTEHLNHEHSKDEKLNCSLCQEEFEGHNDLMQHILVNHITSNKIIFKCQMENCQKMMYRLSDLQSHFIAEHQHNLLLHCTFCYKQKPIDSIYLHVQNHLKNTFKCSYCDLFFEKKEVLFDHIKLIHVGLPKRMNLLVEIINYDRLHSQADVDPNNMQNGKADSKQEESQNLCNESFVIKPFKHPMKYQCFKCTYTSNTEKTLNVHLTSCHSNVCAADFSCSLCKYATDDKESLREHISHHKNTSHNIRIYACSYCKKQSTSMDIIEQHLSNKHPSECFKFKAFQESINYLAGLVECSICSEAYLWKDNFCYHLSSDHKLESLANYLLIKFNSEPITENIVIPKLLYDCKIGSNSCYTGDGFVTKNKNFNDSGIGVPKLANKMLFSCKLCPFQCNKTMNFKRHSAIHEKAEFLNDCYKCAYCQFKHNKFSCIKFHLNKYHNEFPLKILKVSNGEEEEVSLREANGNGNSALQKFYNEPEKLKRSSLIEFVDSFLPRGMIFAEPVKCPYCEFSNRVRVNFVRHMKYHINDKTSSDTDQGYNTVDRLRDTYFDEDGRMSTDDDSSVNNSDAFMKGASTKKLFKCAYCNMVSKWNRRDICLHIIHVHLLKKVYSCNYCSYGSSKSSQQVLYHCSKAHADQPLLIKDELALFNSIVPLKDGDGIIPVAYVKENSEPILNLVKLGKYLKIPIRKHKHDFPDNNVSSKLQNNGETDKTSASTTDIDDQDFNIDMKIPLNDDCQNSDNDVSDFEKNLDNIVEWKCVLCGLQMFNESMMKRHVMCQHLKLKPFSCIYCNAHYWQKQTIENHVRHSHADQGLQYNESAKNQTIDFTRYILKMTNNNIINNEDDTKKPLFTYHCQICGYRASRHDKAKYHIIKKHLKIGLYSCSLCKVYMSTKNCLDRHIRDYHANENAQVMRSYDTHALLLQRSITKIHNSFNSRNVNSCDDNDEDTCEMNEAIKSMTCKHCGYVAKSKFAFNNHARVHRLHVCGYCGYKNRLVNKVQLHCTLKHPRQKLLTHMIEDQILSPQSDDEIGNGDGQFESIENFQSTEDNVFENGSEDATSDFTNQNLQGNSSLFKCNLCEYSSDKVTVIRHHVMSHLLYHPYQCPYCDSAKSVKSSPITKHVNLKHPDEIVRFECIRDEEMEAKVKNSYERVYFDNEGTCTFSTCNDTIMTKREEQMFAMNKRVYYKCCFCSLITPIRTDMKHHLMREIKYKPYSCCYCKYDEPSRSKMGKHFRIKHPGMDVSISDATMPDVELELKGLLQQCMVRIKQKLLPNGQSQYFKKQVKTDDIPIIKISHDRNTLTSSLHYRKVEHKCTLCKYNTYDMKKLVAHKMKHHYTFRKCWQCQLHISDILQYRKHIKKCRSRTTQNPNKCYYKVRPILYPNLMKLIGYREEQSLNKTSHSLNAFVKTYVCDKNIVFCCHECEAKYRNIDQFSTHMQTSHYNLKITFPSIEILPEKSQQKSIKQCGFCSFTCENNEEYGEHVNTHTKLKPIKCKYCLFASFTSSDMKRHFESKHPSQDVGFDALTDSYTMSLPMAVTKKNKLHLNPIVKLIDIQFCLQ